MKRFIEKLIVVNTGFFGQFFENDVTVLFVGNGTIRHNVKEFARKLIKETPKVSRCVHGDMQTGNLIVNDNGAYFIDLGEFACGNPLFDLGCYFYFCHYLPDDYLLAAHYMNAAMMHKCWDVFAKYYFGADTPEKLAAVDARVKPYVLFPILDFEHLMAEDANLKYLEMNFQVARKDLGL